MVHKSSAILRKLTSVVWYLSSNLGFVPFWMRMAFSSKGAYHFGSRRMQLQDIQSVFELGRITVSDVILIITACIVWMSLQATKKANELQYSPAITLKFIDTTKSGSSRNGRIIIRNIGKGPAYNIHLLPMVLNENPRGSFTYTFHLNDRVLEADDERDLDMWVTTPEDGTEAPGMMRFLFRLIPNSFRQKSHRDIFTNTPGLLVINYSGLNGRKYHAIYRLYSVLPPVGEIVMQLLHHGRGRRGMIAARWHHLMQPIIVHAGFKKPVRFSRLTKLMSSAHGLMSRAQRG
jgi:hypothetical protein